MPSTVNHFYAFGPFRLDPRRRRLTRDGEVVPLPPKALDTLLALVQRAGKAVEREELMREVWAGAFVEDANLSVAVSQLRKALGGTDSGVYIETVPRVGYRFVADVREVGDDPPRLVVEKYTVSQTVIEEEDLGEDGVMIAPATTVSRRRDQTVGPRTRVSPAVLLSLVTVLAAAGLVAAHRWTGDTRASANPIKSVAVLPFKVVDASGGNEHLGAGVADALITRLSNVRELSVRPTSAVMALSREGQDSVSAGRTLRVDAVVEGTVYRAPDRVRVTVQLVRVADEASLWAGQFEMPSDDGFAVQDEIALQLVDALALSLSGSERIALTKRYTESADAYQLYLKARYHWNKRNREGMTEAQRLFRNAIERDPSFALALAGLADTMAMNRDPAEAEPAVERALELDPNLAEAHASAGFIAMFHKWDWDGAERSLKRSIELNPGYATAHHWYATLLAIRGKTDEAKVEMRRALEIDPLSYNFLADLGQIHYFAREYDQAKAYCHRALEIYPDFIFAHQYLYNIYLLTGEHEKAVEQEILIFQIVNAQAPDSQREALEAESTAKREIFRRAGVRGYLERQLNGRASHANASVAFAEVCARLGEKEKALDHLEAAHRSHAFLLAFVKADPVFDSLRAEPRYLAILDAMGLAQS